MDKSLLTGILAGAAIVTAGGAIAGYKMLDGGDDYARVQHQLQRRPFRRSSTAPAGPCLKPAHSASISFSVMACDVADEESIAKSMGTMAATGLPCRVMSVLTRW